MKDLFRETGGNPGGLEVTLEKDTQVFKKVNAKSNMVYRENAALQKGETITVGGADKMVGLSYDHRTHQFTPWLGNPDVVEGDETSIRYIRTEDLPVNF